MKDFLEGMVVVLLTLSVAVISAGMIVLGVLFSLAPFILMGAASLYLIHLIGWF